MNDKIKYPNVLFSLLNTFAPNILAAYLRYERDQKENIYKVGNIFYTVRVGYGRAGRRVKLVDIQEKNYNGIIRKGFHVKEVDKDGNLLNNDLGGLFYTFFENIKEDDSRLEGLTEDQKYNILKDSNGDKFLCVYEALAPEDEYESKNGNNI